MFLFNFVSNENYMLLWIRWLDWLKIRFLCIRINGRFV